MSQLQRVWVSLWKFHFLPCLRDQAMSVSPSDEESARHSKTVLPLPLANSHPMAGRPNLMALSRTCGGLARDQGHQEIES